MLNFQINDILILFSDQKYPMVQLIKDLLCIYLSLIDDKNQLLPCQFMVIRALLWMSWRCMKSRNLMPRPRSASTARSVGQNRGLLIVKPKSSPKSKSQIQVPNPSAKSQIQSPEERDWGWHYNPTGHHPPHPTHNFSHLKCQSSDGKRPSMNFLDLPWPSLTILDLPWPSMTF